MRTLLRPYLSMQPDTRFAVAFCVALRMIAAGAKRSEHGCSGCAHGEEHLLCAAVWSDDC
jgi:hypothetical protein